MEQKDPRKYKTLTWTVASNGEREEADWILYWKSFSQLNWIRQNQKGGKFLLTTDEHTNAIKFHYKKCIIKSGHFQFKNGTKEC